MLTRVIFIGSLPSRTLTYILIFLLLGGIIGGIFYYIFKLRGEIKRMPRIPNDPGNDDITGSNPIPEKEGNYGIPR